MELQNFIQQFAEQFDDTDRDVFNSGTKFKELDEWNSLIALSVIAMIDEEYNARIKGDDIRNASTIEDLYKIVMAKL